MPLLYLPDGESLFLWGTEPSPRVLPTLGHGGEPWSATLVAPEGLRDTSGFKLPLFDTMARLAVVPAADLESLPGSVAMGLGQQARDGSRRPRASGADDLSA